MRTLYDARSALLGTVFVLLTAGISLLVLMIAALYDRSIFKSTNASAVHKVFIVATILLFLVVICGIGVCFSVWNAQTGASFRFVAAAMNVICFLLLGPLIAMCVLNPEGDMLIRVVPPFVVMICSTPFVAVFRRKVQSQQNQLRGGAVGEGGLMNDNDWAREDRSRRPGESIPSGDIGGTQSEEDLHHTYSDDDR